MDRYGRHVVTVALSIVAIIHLLPLSGALGAERLASLYGIPIGDANLEILMRHRAVMFGILGTSFLYAAFRPWLQPFALLAGFASVLSFLWLVQSTGNVSEHIERVFYADVVALACLLIGTVAWYAQRRTRG